MKIAVKAGAARQQEWLSKNSAAGVELVWVETGTPEADAYFDLEFEEMGPAFSDTGDKPLFVNAVIKTTAELPAGASRINAWSGLLKRETAEVVLNHPSAAGVLQALGWKYQEVPDVPGMIAARTISMIVNEAYFALGDEVSSKEEIDLAMKLGTNYPAGPFEWARSLGLHNIYRLLRRLAETDARYLPAPALEQELKSIA